MSLELRAQEPDGRAEEHHTGRRTDRKPRGCCCSCFALIFVSPHLCASGNKEKNLAHPGTLARIAWASRVWHWLDSPYYGQGRGRYASVQCPNLRSTNVHESARPKKTQTRDPVMRLRWFWVADGERGNCGTCGTCCSTSRSRRSTFEPTPEAGRPRRSDAGSR